MRQHGSGDRRFYQLAVPKDIQPSLDKKRITESLKTDSVTVARKRRDERLVYWRHMFDELRKTEKPDKTQLRKIFLDGSAWARRHLELNADHGAEELHDALFTEHGSGRHCQSKLA
ncbi:MAG: hypothetical protein HKN11_04435 [Rhizobiales bacterium]|nr:hypothetical protein [Hyphomicrobiales bacterium]